MSVTMEELDRFHDFASSLVSGPETDITWPQLFEAWCLHNSSVPEYEENVAAIRESLDAMDAGRMRPFSAFDAEFRCRQGMTGDA
jgi:hypothetical protein